MQACVQAHMEENKKFWTYFQHLEAQKHQFTLYMKRKDERLPKLVAEAVELWRH